jgi:nicotinate-nucleotide adenylyltransferase
LKVAILGGAFDPIHKGHMHMIYNTSKLGVFDEVWIMPCYNSLYNKQMVKDYHRVNMCCMALDYLKKLNDYPFVLSTFEIDNKLNGSTFDTLKLLKEKYNYMFSFIIGQDNADSIESWINYKQLINENQFIVYPRCDQKQTFEQLKGKWYLQEPHYYMYNEQIPDVSSTQIRQIIKTCKTVYSTHTLLTIKDYIKEHNLYGTI